MFNFIIKKILYKGWGWLWVILLGIVAACKPECESPRTNFILMRFAKKSNFSNDTIRLRNLNGVGVGLNFLRRDTAITQFGLPISPQSTEIAYAFESVLNNQAVRDTIYLRYQRRLFFIKPNCGLTEDISDLQIVRSTFDTAWVAKTTLVNRKEGADVVLILR